MVSRPADVGCQPDMLGRPIDLLVAAETDGTAAAAAAGGCCAADGSFGGQQSRIRYCYCCCCCYDYVVHKVDDVLFGGWNESVE